MSILSTEQLGHIFTDRWLFKDLSFGIQKGDRIYHAGEKFRSVYAVRSGAIKTISNTQDGQEQITGFYLPGEIIGITTGLATLALILTQIDFNNK